jgi:hypothetical protein
MNDLPPDAIDFGEVLRSLFRGWRTKLLLWKA